MLTGKNESLLDTISVERDGTACFVFTYHGKEITEQSVLTLAKSGVLNRDCIFGSVSRTDRNTLGIWVCGLG